MNVPNNIKHNYISFGALWVLLPMKEAMNNNKSIVSKWRDNKIEKIHCDNTEVTVSIKGCHGFMKKLSTEPIKRVGFLEQAKIIIKKLYRSNHMLS